MVNRVDNGESSTPGDRPSSTSLEGSAAMVVTVVIVWDAYVDATTPVVDVAVQVTTDSRDVLVQTPSALSTKEHGAQAGLWGVTRPLWPASTLLVGLGHRGNCPWLESFCSSLPTGCCQRTDGPCQLNGRTCLRW